MIMCKITFMTIAYVGLNCKQHMCLVWTWYYSQSCVYEWLQQSVYTEVQLVSKPVEHSVWPVPVSMNIHHIRLIILSKQIYTGNCTAVRCFRSLCWILIQNFVNTSSWGWFITAIAMCNFFTNVQQLLVNKQYSSFFWFIKYISNCS